MANHNPKQKSIASFFNRRPVDQTISSEVGNKNNDNNNETVTSGPTKPDSQGVKCDWPDVWTMDMWGKKKVSYPWIDCRNGMLGCKICSDLSSLGAFKTERISLSNEWRSYGIKSNGSNRDAQLKSLRKKIIEHKQSQAHLAAQRIIDTSKKQSIETVCDALNVTHKESTKTVFRSAYYLAKNDRPYSDHFELLELQRLNGVDIGVGLHSRYSATSIIDHVAHEMKVKITSKIKNEGGKISIILDESTSLSSKSVLIVYLKCETSKDKDPETLLLDLVELTDQKSETVFEAVIKTLTKYGFDNDYLKQNLVAFTSDGANVMLGNRSGVAARFLTKFPNLIIWHCVNHRIELALTDAVEEVSGVNHFHSFMNKLYTVYSTSPKNQRQLSECALQLSVQLNKVGRVLNTRWVASSFRTVTAVWYSYSVLAAHFSSCTNDTTRSSTERSTFKGLLNRFTSNQFLLDLAVMYDVLCELSMLSESLQNRNMTIVKADKLIRRSIRYITSLKEKPGTKTLEAKIAIREGVFDSVSLKQNPKFVTINAQQLLSSVVNNLNSRLFTTYGQNEEAYKKLLLEFHILDTDHWPTDIPERFGEEEILSLCKRFKLDDRKVNYSFREYLDCSRRVPDGLKELINCTKLVNCSSAECERGFSLMNIILTPTRNLLTVSHVSSLLFVKLHGAPMASWNPEPYVDTWLRSHRGADDTRTRVAKNEKNTEDKRSGLVVIN